MDNFPLKKRLDTKIEIVNMVVELKNIFIREVMMHFITSRIIKEIYRLSNAQTRDTEKKNLEKVRISFSQSIILIMRTYFDRYYDHIFHNTSL